MYAVKHTTITKILNYIHTSSIKLTAAHICGSTRVNLKPNFGSISQPNVVSVEKRKLTYYHTLYQTISSRNWGRVDALLSQYKSEGLNYDEVIYTLLAHMHILSPTSRCENAYLVIEEMKQAQMSPTIIRMNQMLINSYLELEGIFCQPPKNAWQSILRMAWQSALAFVRARKKQLLKTLEEMPPDQLLSITAQDIDEMVRHDNMINSSRLEIEESQDIPIPLGIELKCENQLSEHYQVQELQQEALQDECSGV